MTLGLMTNLVSLVLAFVCQKIGIPGLPGFFGAAMLGGFVVWTGIAWYSLFTFRCPRCDKLFSNSSRIRRCVHCGLPIYAPRNPDS
jgi:hypothetical protein